MFFYCRGKCTTSADNVTFVDGSVRINGDLADEGVDYTFIDGVLTVFLGDVVGGEEKIVTFQVTVDEDAYGMQIKNTATITGIDDNYEDIDEEVEEPDGGRVVDNPIDPYAEKSSENLTSTDGRSRVGDSIRYTIIVGNDNADSLWRDVIVGDKLPEYVTFTDGSVQINGAAADEGTDYTYNESTRALRVELGDIAGASEKVITFDVTIDPNAYGRTIRNSATVSDFEEDVLENGELNVEEAERLGITVVFNPQSGVLQGSATKTVYTGNIYGILPSATRTDYTFNGWYTAATGGSRVIADAIVTNESNHVLYAQWTYSGVDDGGGRWQRRWRTISWRHNNTDNTGYDWGYSNNP